MQIFDQKETILEVRIYQCSLFYLQWASLLLLGILCDWEFQKENL